MVYGIERVLKHERREAKKEGKLEGKSEGKLEGKLEGIEEKAIEVAKKMIDKGFSFEDIADTTELSILTIQELAKKCEHL